MPDRAASDPFGSDARGPARPTLLLNGQPLFVSGDALWVPGLWAWFFRPESLADSPRAHALIQDAAASFCARRNCLRDRPPFSTLLGAFLECEPHEFFRALETQPDAVLSLDPGYAGESGRFVFRQALRDHDAWLAQMLGSELKPEAAADRFGDLMGLGSVSRTTARAMWLYARDAGEHAGGMAAGRWMVDRLVGEPQGRPARRIAAAWSTEIDRALSAEGAAEAWWRKLWHWVVRTR